MKTFKILSILILSILLLQFCTKNNNVIPTTSTIDESAPSLLEINSLRANFIENEQNKDLYTYEQIDQIVISKLNQLLSLGLPETENNLISQLIIEIPNFRQGLNTDIGSIGNNLASIIPEEDFYLMFVDMDDYNYNGDYQSTLLMPTFRKDEIAMMNFIPISDGSSSDQRVPPCNCYWMCSDPNTTKCRPKRLCGFLLLQECTRNDIEVLGL